MIVPLATGARTHRRTNERFVLHVYPAGVGTDCTLAAGSGLDEGKVSSDEYTYRIERRQDLPSS
jgi:hypothetical protein